MPPLPPPHLNTHAGSGLRLSSSAPKASVLVFSHTFHPKIAQTHCFCLHTHRHPALSLAVSDVNKVRAVRGDHAWTMTHRSAPLATAGLHLPGTHTHSMPRWPSHPHQHFPRTQRHIHSLPSLSHILVYLTSHMCVPGTDYWISLLTLRDHDLSFTPSLASASSSLHCVILGSVTFPALPSFPHLAPPCSDTECIKKVLYVKGINAICM